MPTSKDPRWKEPLALGDGVFLPLILVRIPRDAHEQWRQDHLPRWWLRLFPVSLREYIHYIGERRPKTYGKLFKL